MKLIKDLGMQYATNTSKRKRRYGLYECPSCLKPYKLRADTIMGSTHKCVKCSTTKHGDCNSKLYKTLSRMINRCNNKNKDNYKDYGGRGIKVCSEWENDYTKFKKWALQNGYEEHLTIDRIDNDGDYEPSNCRWVSMTVQSRNTRKLRTTNTSGYRGVSWYKNAKKWHTSIKVNSKTVHLGFFDYPWMAAYVYDSYVLKHNLEHTRNFT